MSIPSDTAATWSALQQLLGKALETPAADRLIWLERSTEVPDHLREPLRRLLEVQAGIDTRAFLATFPRDDADLTPATPPLIGDMVGPYRLLQELGDGGMGSVWLAERADGALKRKVALKLPRLAWATDLAGRMSRERDILGSLEHPNIARLYDAGLDQHGRPFLALEYVEGQRLDRYCDDQRLSVEERVRLFLQVLDAVQHAHINLVLHRDLKPANILVNLRGEVRLLDFGIAKLVADERGSSDGALRSETLSRAMTPRFASPEQVQHQRLTLASDIYSLGVVLYEILIGASPLITTNGSRAEYEIAIVDSRLRTPSRARLSAELALQRRATPARVARSLRGDLDAVLMKAMAKTPADRYVSAEALRADLVRWLDGRPVAATPPSTLAALKKFVARNTMAVGLGTAAIAAIVATATIAVLQAREAQIESRRATAARDFILSLFDNANPELHGGRDISARELLLSKNPGQINSLRSHPDLHAEVLGAVADAWGRIGDYNQMVEAARHRTKIFREANLHASYFKALIDEALIEVSRRNLSGVKKIMRELRDEKLAITKTQESESDLYWLEGWLSSEEGRFAFAQKRFEASLNAAPPGDKARVMRSKYGLMKSQFKQGKREDAVYYYRSALRDAQSNDLSVGERLRRSEEIVAVLYENGDYGLGWNDVDALFKELNKQGVRERLHQNALTLIWVNWAIKVGELAKVTNFFSEYESKINDLEGAGRGWLKTEWRLTEARLCFVEGAYSKVDRVLRSVNGAELDRHQQKTFDLITAETAILQNNPEKAISIISSKKWTKVIDSRNRESLDWAVYRGWIEGVALHKLNEYEKSHKTLSEAYGISEVVFGKTHPHSSKIALAILLSSLKKNPSTIPFGDVERAIVAEKNLRMRLPANNIAVVSAEKLLRIAQLPNEERSKDVRTNRLDQLLFL